LLFDLAGAKTNPKATAETTISIPIKDLGIAYPVLVRSVRLHDDEIPLPGFEDDGKQIAPGVTVPGAEGAAAKPGVVNKITVPRYDFAIQFCWKETPFSKRREKAKAGEGEKSPALAGTAVSPTQKN
jgi:hypothetical protein